MLRILNIARLRRVAFHCALLLATGAAAACQRVPLLAPSGSTITLTSLATAVPANGSVQLIAQVLEAAGTPPHSGTHVIFTTTLGTIEPSETETDINGRAVATFKAGTANGTATITAASGGAAVASANALKIAVGTAAVGGLTLGASPSSLSANGGSSTITANVVDISGNVLSGVPVAFTTDVGAVSPSSSTTDANGTASTVLTTTRTAKVTAVAGIGTTGGTGTTGGGAVQTKDVTVTVNIGPSISLSAPTPANPAVGQAVSITMTVTAPGTTGSPLRTASINWGDGTTTTVGSSTATVQHVYNRTGTFTIIATATDTNGDTTTAVSAVTVINGTPSIGVSADDDTPTVGQLVTFTINASIPGSPTGVAIQQIHIDYGDGAGQDLGASATSAKHTYTSAGTRLVTVTATTTAGTTTSGSLTVQVQ
jgi:adhesin/invasin